MRKSNSGLHIFIRILFLTILLSFHGYCFPVPPGSYNLSIPLFHMVSEPQMQRFCYRCITWGGALHSKIYFHVFKTLAVTTACLFWTPPPRGAWEEGKIKLFCLKESRFGALEILALSKQTSKPTKKHQKIKIPNQNETRLLLQQLGEGTERGGWMPQQESGSRKKEAGRDFPPENSHFHFISDTHTVGSPKALIRKVSMCKAQNYHFILILCPSAFKCSSLSKRHSTSNSLFFTVSTSSGSQSSANSGRALGSAVQR